MVPLHPMLAALIRWIAGEQQEMIEYLRAENRVLKAQLRGRRGRLPARNGDAWPSSARGWAARS